MSAPVADEAFARHLQQIGQPRRARAPLQFDQAWQGVAHSKVARVGQMSPSVRMIQRKCLEWESVLPER